MDSDRASQIEEIEALQAIFGEELTQRAHNSFVLQIATEGSNFVIRLFFSFPPDYPSTSPPNFTVEGPCFTTDKVLSIETHLLSLFQEAQGQPVIFQFVDFIRNEIFVEPDLVLDNNENIEQEEEYPEYKSDNSPENGQTHNKHITKELSHVAELINKASYVLIIAGAGFGIDSGLPDYRGTTGFWNDFGPAKKLGMNYAEMSTPKWYQDDPELAWGFATHLVNMYRNVVPHEGFHILRKICELKGDKYFVFTSNVDGEFQKAGFPESKIYEVHGTVHYLQCTEPKKCKRPKECWPLDMKELPSVHPETFRAQGALPKCKYCGKLARLNVSLFNDSEYVDRQSKYQKERFVQWIRKASKEGSLVMIELGCGLSEHSIRLDFDETKNIWKCRSGEWKMGFGIDKESATLIRINPLHPEVPKSQIGVPAGGLFALKMCKNFLMLDQI